MSAGQDLDKRLTKLDDDIGRVGRIERHLDATATGWGKLSITRKK